MWGTLCISDEGMVWRTKDIPKSMRGGVVRLWGLLDSVRLLPRHAWHQGMPQNWTTSSRKAMMVSWLNSRGLNTCRACILRIPVKWDTQYDRTGTFLLHVYFASFFCGFIRDLPWVSKKEKRCKTASP